MMWHDGRFARHSRFRYWLLDTSLRLMTPGMQRTFFKTREAASQYTLEDLGNKDIRRNLVQQMSTATNQLPGSIGERRKMRQQLEAMVHQIEAETADLGENAGAGRIPAGFCTLTCPVYKWRQLHDTLLKSYPSGNASDPKAREYYQQWHPLPSGPEKEVAMKKAFYELAVGNPAAVDWYCSLKLELAVHLVKQLLTQAMQSPSVPGLDKLRERIEAELVRKLGDAIKLDETPDLVHMGLVDEFYASFEWSDGGILHAHIAFWMIGAPRIDKIQVPREKEENVVEIDANEDESTALANDEAANLLGSYWDRVLTEFNVAKALSGASAQCNTQQCQACNTQQYTDSDGQALPATEVRTQEPPFEGTDATANPTSTSVDVNSLFVLRADTGVRQKLGKKIEREKPTPETLSYEALSHCLLGGKPVTWQGLEEDQRKQEESRAWDELVSILTECGRGGATRDIWRGMKNSENQDEKRATARKLFVATLAEWVNMHDLHRPFACGPPSKDQPCASVENEHSSKEKVSCNKLFPRKIIEPGTEEVAEDPRRRELYRLWLTRNCHFLNNYVPIILLAMDSNMDFQATLTCDAVIEYMTKYMTKAGHGSLIRVMEHSFSVCIEKTRERLQGTGAAVLRWFNLQSITEVKSQLEAVHLLSGTPRYLCSREFKILYMNSEIRLLKSKDQIAHAESKDESIAVRSRAEVYINRDQWNLPTRSALLTKHPLSRRPLWREILAIVASPVTDSDTLDDHFERVEASWPAYVNDTQHGS